MTDSVSDIGHELYLPFASGPRSCIGARYATIEMKACISNLIVRYKFEVCSKTQNPLEYFTGQPVSSAKEVTLKVSRLSTK